MTEDRDWKSPDVVRVLAARALIDDWCAQHGRKFDWDAADNGGMDDFLQSADWLTALRNADVVMRVVLGEPA